MTPFADADYPADPYPGAAPDGSFVHHERLGHRLRPDPARPTRWRLAGPDLDEPGHDLDAWLADRHAEPLAARVPVLAYGSNRCPSKITWLRAELGLTGPVVVLAAQVEDVAAVWASGLRARDGQRPAVLTAAPGAREQHSVWLATPRQVGVLDRCEGRGERYRLARLRSGRVRTGDGTLLDRPYCYLGLAPARLPLLVDGAPVRCQDVAQQAARGLRGVPATGDGLATDEVTGSPEPPHR